MRCLSQWVSARRIINNLHNVYNKRLQRARMVRGDFRSGSLKIMQNTRRQSHAHDKQTSCGGKRRLVFFFGNRSFLYWLRAPRVGF
jgi:hypothetical protein